MSEAERIEHEPWPIRALLLLVLGALAGLAIYLLTNDIGTWTEDRFRLGAAAFVAVAGIVFAFSLERVRWTWSTGFALAAGLVVGSITWANGSPGSWGPGEGWRFAASLFSVAVAVPLFQAMRDSGRRRLASRAVHEHVWTNVILGGLAGAFVIAVWLLVNMLGALFDLIGLDFLERLLREEWLPAMLLGGALGAGVGMLRDRDGVLVLLQRVGRTILAVLAPVLAAGLVIFVLALPFTGLESLWRETKETTPILLACVFGAFVLANAVIGHAAEEEAKARPLRWAAMALGAVMLPLAIVAAVSMAKRIGQYGFTPDRLWATVVVVVAVAGAGLYIAALVRGRTGWAELARRYNVALAAGVCLLALFLALPIVNFGAISTRDQLARLESGRVTPEKFDWAALRFDFGPAGRAAVERLARGRDPRIAGLARHTLALESRWDAVDLVETSEQQALAPTEIIVRPAGAPVPADLRALILRRPADRGTGICDGPGDCLLFWKPGSEQAIVMLDGCAPRIVGAGNQARAGVKCTIDPTVVERDPTGRWGVAWSNRSVNPIGPDRQVTPAEEQRMLEAQRAAIERGDVEIREVRQRRLYIGGKAEGDLFD